MGVFADGFSLYPAIRGLRAGVPPEGRDGRTAMEQEINQMADESTTSAPGTNLSAPHGRIATQPYPLGDFAGHVGDNGSFISGSYGPFNGYAVTTHVSTFTNYPSGIPYYSEVTPEDIQRGVDLLMAAGYAPPRQAPAAPKDTVPGRAKRSILLDGDI